MGNKNTKSNEKKKKNLKISETNYSQTIIEKVLITEESYNFFCQSNENKNQQFNQYPIEAQVFLNERDLDFKRKNQEKLKFDYNHHTIDSKKEIQYLTNDKENINNIKIEKKVLKEISIDNQLSNYLFILLTL
jgi:hypothetical protein